MKESVVWHSDRLDQEVRVTRWGSIGVPVLLFPTAGGDAEEVERFHLVSSARELLEDGKVKIYSCDSVAGRTWFTQEGTLEHRAAMQNQFHEFIYREVVPAIRKDCNDPEIETIASGSSIGAYNALAVLCRYPDAFSSALCMSGTYRLETLVEAKFTEDFYRSSPTLFVPDLEGDSLEKLRTRFAIFASGEGRAEDIGESWNAADVLGRKGIPNRVDSWGTAWDHDWPTWRNMFPKYLGELIERNGDSC